MRLQAPLDVEGVAGRVEALAARASGRRLVSVTVELGEAVDPVAVAFGSRRADDRWFTFEQPDRDFALAGVGSVAELVSRGSSRFRDLVAGASELFRNRLAEEPEGLPAGAGPILCGGFAFADDGCREPIWASLAPALMFLPEISILRHRDRSFLTAVALGGAEGLAARLASLRAAALPMLDPHPVRGATISSALPPRHFEEIVRTAVREIRGGALEKVVLAREVRVEAPRAHSPGGLLGALREAFPSCFSFCVGSPEAAYCGASPELLVRRTGAGATTVALAGSTRRSADPAVDDHLAERLLHSPKERSEHEIVAKRIERMLRPVSVWVESAPEPAIIKVANIQHLATPIRAQLAEPLSAIELAARLHPTPAVGGEPSERALPLIERLEEMDRGWYAGPVGWMDATEDGEFCVALRSGLIRDRVAHLYAGGGIVADSDPAAELAETETKLGALLPVLAG